MKKKIALLTCLFSVISFACPYCDAMDAATQKEDEKPDNVKTKILRS